MFPRRLEITASAGHKRRYTFFQDGQVVPRHSRRNAEELASARSVLAGLVSVFGNGLRSRRHREGVEDSGGQLQPLAQRSGQGLPFWRVLFGCGFPQKPPPPPPPDMTAFGFHAVGVQVRYWTHRDRFGRLVWPQTFSAAPLLHPTEDKLILQPAL